MKNSKLVPLKKMETVTGKKDSRDLVYTYLDFKFKLHRLGDNSEGKAMYRLSALNFDAKLLKAYSQKNTNLKDACTLQLNDPKTDLLTIFNAVIEVKMKKELARLAYEKALKDGTLPVKEEVVKETKKDNPYKKEFYKNKDFKKNSFSRDNKNSDSRKNSFSKDKSNNNTRDNSFSKDNRNNNTKDTRNDDSRKNSFSRDSRNTNSKDSSSTNKTFSKDNRNFKSKPKANGFSKNKPSYTKKK